MVCNSFVILRGEIARGAHSVGVVAIRLAISAGLGIVLCASTSALSAAEPPNDEVCQGEIYRAFDFWLGAWQVHLADGRFAGTNRISTTADGCLLQERWEGAAGSQGYSINFYDPQHRVWRQLWVSADNIIEISGGLQSGSGGSDAAGGGSGVAESMVLVGEIRYRKTGLSHPFRGTWTPLPDGRVRQYFEEQPADTWQPWFEGFYAKAVE